MKCPECDAEVTNVLTTRPSRHGPLVIRYRRCPKCRKRFKTAEAVLLDPLKELQKIP